VEDVNLLSPQQAYIFSFSSQAAPPKADFLELFSKKNDNIRERQKIMAILAIVKEDSNWCVHFTDKTFVGKVRSDEKLLQALTDILISSDTFWTSIFPDFVCFTKQDRFLRPFVDFLIRSPGKFSPEDFEESMRDLRYSHYYLSVLMFREFEANPATFEFCKEILRRDMELQRELMVYTFNDRSVLKLLFKANIDILHHFFTVDDFRCSPGCTDCGDAFSGVAADSS